jgi:hypothetical protein
MDTTQDFRNNATQITLLREIFFSPTAVPLRQTERQQTLNKQQKH